MSFNKKILALAVASALPGLSQAAFDMDTQATTVLYADEIVVTPFPTGTVLQNVGNILDVDVVVGFSIVGTSKYVRFNYPGTRMSRNLISSDFAVAGGLVSVSQGGTTADEFVIIEIAAVGAGGVANTATLNFNVPVAADGVVTGSKTDHSITYALYNNPGDAQNQANALVNKAPAAPWYKFQKALAASCNKNGISTAQIDVTNPALFKSNPSIPGPFANPLFNLQLALSGTVFKADGTAVVIGDYIPASSSIRVDGNFFNIAPPNPAFTAGLPGFPAVIDASLIFATLDPTVVGFLPQLGIAPASTFSITNNAITPMSPTNYSVTIFPGPNAISITPINLGVCGSLVYSGSSDRIDLGLTPVSAGGVNKQWLRITNPSNTSGDVAVSVWNDAGVRVDFPLSSIIVGPAPGTALPVTLNAQSSTPLFTIDQVYAAAQAVNQAFTVGTGVDGKPGKLRVEVRGAFGDDHLDSHLQYAPPSSLTLGAPSTVRLKNGIYIQAVSSATTFQSH